MNASRLITKAQCPQQFFWRYKKHLASHEPRPQALTVGSAWHSCMEHLAGGTWSEEAAEGIVDRHATPALNQAALDCDAAGLHSRAKDLRTFGTMLGEALKAYVRKYKDGPPTGQTICTEQDFWFRLTPKVIIRGRWDKLSLTWLGEVTLTEHKTCGDKEDFPTYMALRQGHLQDALYWRALFVLWELGIIQELCKRAGVGAPRKLGGVQYDLLRKSAYPVKASKNGTVEERREAWENALFHYEHVPWDEEKATPLLLEAGWWATLPSGKGHRNRFACKTYDRISCEFFALCWQGADVRDYATRERDYVDTLAEGDEK